jgi:hypothetical protein
MANYDTSLVMMSAPSTWPLDTLPLKRRLDKAGMGLPTFGVLRRETLYRAVYAPDGKVVANYDSALAALEDGWRVD